MQLHVIDELGKTEDEECRETSAQLQNRLYYEGETLELIVDVLNKYKAQSLKSVLGSFLCRPHSPRVRYLDSIVHLAFVVLKMLERFSKSKDRMYVRKRRKARPKRKAAGEGEEGEEEQRDEEEIEIDEGTVDYAEKAFQFEQFEAVSLSLETRPLQLTRDDSASPTRVS